MWSEWIGRLLPVEGSRKQWLFKVAWVTLRIVALLLLSASSSTFVYEQF